MDADNVARPDGACRAGQVAAAARLLGVVVDDDDLVWLADAMEEQRAVEAIIDGLVLDDVDPLLTFDPRWND
ncbi:MAG TPA: hypothetical protein VGN41_13905 [Streptosporangiaceae bacterium]|jgi:hypothetical protein